MDEYQKWKWRKRRDAVVIVRMLCVSEWVNGVDGRAEQINIIKQTRDQANGMNERTNDHFHIHLQTRINVRNIIEFLNNTKINGHNLPIC